MLAGFFGEGAEALDLGDAGGGEFGEYFSHVVVARASGVFGVETGGALFGGDDEAHGFVEASVVAGVDEAGADADG